MTVRFSHSIVAAFAVLLLAALLSAMALPPAGPSFSGGNLQATLSSATATASVTPTLQSEAGTPTQPSAASTITTTIVPTATVTVTATLFPTETSPVTTPTVVSTITSDGSSASPSATAAPASSGSSGKVNLDAILPPAKGRDLLLDNCTSCHSFVCAVIGQRTADYWETVKLGHRARVSSLSDDDVNTLFAYLAANFNDKKPVPEIPPELASLGCTAQ